MKNSDKILRISLFFYCSTNQTFNTSKNVQTPDLATKTSHESNIMQSNMWRLYCSLQKNKSLYIQSVYIGEKSSAQNTVGNLAKFITDFDHYKSNSKTQIALNNILDILKSYSLDHKNTELQLKIDLFGFSSGAAVARNFANLLNSDREVLDEIRTVLRKNNNVLKELTFGFLGLFDTLKINLGNPTKTGINLDLKDIKADAIFHLTAMHEFRKNTPLLSVFNSKLPTTSTDLDTFGSKSNRVTNTFEFAVPGSHTDIGGGNSLFEDEDYIINHKPTFTAANLIDSIQNIIDTNLLLAPLFSTVKFEYNIFRGGYTAINRRKNVYGHLQLLYARLMVDTAVQFGVPFNLSEFETAHSIPTELKYFYCELVESRNLLLNVKTFNSPINALDHQLIQKYVHLSPSALSLNHNPKKKSKMSILRKSPQSRNDLFSIKLA